MENNNYDFEAFTEKETEENEAIEVTDIAEKPKSHFKESKWFSKEKIRLYGFIGGAVALVLAVLFVSLYIKSDKVGKALDSERYNRVQIKISQTIEYLETEEEEGTGEEITTSEDGYVYNDGGLGNYYYDENGTLITDEEAPVEEEQQDNTTTYDVSTIRFDGDTIHEKSDLGETYYFTRDGQRFVIYYYEDLLTSIKREEGEDVKGEWIETPGESYGTLVSFDLKVLDAYVESDFKKVEDHYVPKGNVEEVFFDFLRIKQVENYTNTDIKFYFDNGKMSKIVAAYTYDDTMNIVQTYKFSYEDEKIVIPEADKKYDAEGQLIEGGENEK